MKGSLNGMQGLSVNTFPTIFPLGRRGQNYINNVSMSAEHSHYILVFGCILGWVGRAHLYSGTICLLSTSPSTHANPLKSQEFLQSTRRCHMADHSVWGKSTVDVLLCEKKWLLLPQGQVRIQAIVTCKIYNA